MPFRDKEEPKERTNLCLSCGVSPIHNICECFVKVYRFAEARGVKFIVYECEGYEKKKAKRADIAMRKVLEDHQKEMP